MADEEEEEEEEEAGWRYQHEVLRRTLAALPPRSPALDREEALTLLDELITARKQLDDLQGAIERARRSHEERPGPAVD